MTWQGSRIYFCSCDTLENILLPWQFWRYFQSIGYFPNSLSDGIWPDVTRAKLACHSKSHDALGWGDLKENLVSYFKI